MNFVDLFIIVLALAAAVRGVATGFFRQVGSLAGLLLGLLFGALAASWFAGYMPLGSNRSVGLELLVFAIAFVISGIGEAIGTRAAGAMDRAGLSSLDGVLGAALGFFGSLVAVWLLAASFGNSAGPLLAVDIQNSRILISLDRVLPPAPDITARLKRLIGASRFPQVFAGLEPTPAPPVTGPNAEAVNAAVAAAKSATVKIEGTGCGGVVEGSGFVVGNGLVVTNAHVVAGINNPVITDRAGLHRSTVVEFDPNLDIAVLRTSGLDANPLPVDSAIEQRGTVAAVLGYPGGGGFTAGAAAILERQSAVGRNIYDSGLIRRDIYVLQAVVRPGNSGGPLVSPTGVVIGVVFATSTTDPNVGYALTSAEIGPDVAAAQSSGPVDTGPCIAE